MPQTLEPGTFRHVRGQHVCGGQPPERHELGQSSVPQSDLVSLIGRPHGRSCTDQEDERERDNCDQGDRQGRRPGTGARPCRPENHCREDEVQGRYQRYEQPRLRRDGSIEEAAGHHQGCEVSSDVRRERDQEPITRYSVADSAEQATRPRSHEHHEHGHRDESDDHAPGDIPRSTPRDSEEPARRRHEASEVGAGVP